MRGARAKGGGDVSSLRVLYSFPPSARRTRGIGTTAYEQVVGLHDVVSRCLSGRPVSRARCPMDCQ
jgi:hypothetical protein